MKKVFIIGLIAVLTVMCSGCTEGKAHKNMLQRVDSSYSTQEIYGWNSRAELEEIDASPNFGIARLNTDRQYIRTGSGSMYIRVDEVRYNQNVPVPVIANKASPYIRLYVSDFKKISDYSIYRGIFTSIYNASSRDVGIDIMLTTATGYVEGYAATSQMLLGRKVLKKDQWNSVEFLFDTVRAAYQGIGSVRYLDILFDAKDYNQQPAELYMDNISFIKSDSKIVKTQTPAYEGGNIICGYENSWFAAAATPFFPGNYYQADVLFHPQLFHNTDTSFVSGGNGSLKVVRKPDAYKYKREEVMITEAGLFAIEYLKSIDFYGRDIATHSIVMDVYCDYDFPIDFGLVAGDSVGIAQKTYVLEPGTWNTIEFPMDTLTADGNNINWASLTRFNMQFFEFFGGNDAVHYVDNIRFVSAQ